MNGLNARNGNTGQGQAMKHHLLIVPEAFDEAT
jgi:hypothetical protein